MGWARLDDGFHDHPKLFGLDLAAVGLFTLALTWAAEHDSGGRIPHELVHRYKRGHQLAAELVAAALWTETDDGWLLVLEAHGNTWGIVRGKHRAKIPIRRRQQIYERDRYACRLCASTAFLTLDHIQPWSRGGRDTEANLQTLCMPCNRSKGAVVR